LFLASGFDPTHGINRRCHYYPIDIRRKIRDFPLTLERAPESKARFLLDVLELDA